MSAVKVTGNDAGMVIVPSQNNPEYGYIRVEQKTIEIVNGWTVPRVKSALIKGKLEDLQALGFAKDQELPGKIAIKETLEPTNPNNVYQDMKVAGLTKISCTFNDQPIYRTAVYDSTGKIEDVLIQHSNHAEIKAANRIRIAGPESAVANLG